MAPYGDGTLIRRGRVWYARFYVRGREVRESLHTADEETAKKRAAARRRKRERGAYVDPGRRRVTIDQLLDDLVRHLEVRKVASLPKVNHTSRLSASNSATGLPTTSTPSRSRTPSGSGLPRVGRRPQ